MNETYLKEAGIDVDHGLELLGDMEVYHETLQDFLTEVEERLPKLEAYKKNEDMENYAILVHAMKSDSNYLGFTKLAELSYQHESKSKAGDSSYIEEHYQELMEEVARIIKVVQTYLGQ